MYYAASTLFIFHRRLRILSHWHSWAFRYHILKSELTSGMQSVVGVAMLRHSRLPRRHTLCSLHTIHLSENIANLVTLVLLGFPLPYTKKRIDERYAVGRRRRYAPPLPAARTIMYYAASTLFIFHRRLRILSHWYSWAFREHILKSELTSAMQSVVGVAMLRHSRLLAFMNNLRVAYYAKSIPCWQNLSKKFRETSLTQVNDVRRETARMHPKPKLLF